METNKEDLKYQELSRGRKDYVDALKNIGFSWKYHHVYEKLGCGVIDVSRIGSWSELLSLMFQLGKDQKRFEILQTLGL